MSKETAFEQEDSACTELKESEQE